MKIPLTILAFILFYTTGYSQNPIHHSQVPTGFLYKKEINNQFYDCGINDHKNCFENLSWYNNYITFGQLKVDPQIQMTHNFMFFGNVIGEVKRTGKGQVILLDQEINVIREGAFADGTLKRTPDGTILVMNPNGQFLDTDRLTYIGIQLPSLEEGMTDVVLKLDDEAIFSNYNRSSYSLEFEINKPKQTNYYTIGFGQEVTIPLSELLNSEISCTVRHNGVIINVICYKIPDIPYDPETLDIPHTYVTCVIYEDTDQDGIYEDFDNCSDVYNPYQQDTDGDGKGDACDEDIDGDGVLNVDDNCVYNWNPNQTDNNNNNIGDFCEGDIDGDGIIDAEDNCVYISNYTQEDMDNDGIGDMCDDDMDGDGVPNDVDNCVTQANHHQTDKDNDGIGDACDPDIDNDGIKNEDDNCVFTANSNQSDIDADGIGDACDNTIGDPDPENPEIEVSSDCVIQPDLDGTLEAEEDFIVKWTGDPSNGDADLLIGDFVDFTLYCTENHPGVNAGSKGVIDYDIYINPERNTVKYPIIVSDGFDFVSMRDKDDIFRGFGGNKTLRALWKEGYDLIICDFKGGGDFIQKNGFALQNFIKFIKDEYELDEIPALIGPSMGGQIARFALLDWEANKVSEWGPHNVQVFLSADSPWRGANASPALQALAYQKDDIDILQQIRLMINAPAARQMLLNHVNGESFVYVASSHPFKGLLDAEYLAMGDVPAQVGRLIAIADGSASGVSDGNAPINTSFVSMTATVDIGITTLSLGGLDMKTIDKDEYFVVSNVSSDIGGFHSVLSDLSGGHMDSAPGSKFNLSQAIKDGQIIDKSGYDIKIEYSEALKRNFCFIPTFSALNINTSNAFLNISGGAQAGVFGFTHSLSPFDELFFDLSDDTHNGFENEANGLNDFEFFLGNLNTLVDASPGDVDCAIAQGLISEVDAIQNLDLSFTCNDVESTNSCFTSVFPTEIDWTIEQTGGYQTISFIEDNGVFIAEYTGDGSQDVFAYYEVCGEITLDGCITTVCSDVKVNVTMTEDCEHFELHDPGGEYELRDKDQKVYNQQGITIFPNPAYDAISINNQFKGQLLIYNVDGKLVQSNDLRNFNETIPLQLNTGLYQVKILNEKGELEGVQKLVIVK